MRSFSFSKRFPNFLSNSWFTNLIIRTLIRGLVSPIPQRYNLKAIHNDFSLIFLLRRVSPIPQRYNLKAIHNQSLLLLLQSSGVTNTSKIQSESKIDEAKAIHNSAPASKRQPDGVTNTSKIQSESNSQHYFWLAFLVFLQCVNWLT